MAARRATGIQCLIPCLIPCLQASALLAVAVTLAVPARAEVRIVESRADALVIETRDATVREVLDALAAKRLIDFRGSEALSRPVSGTYSGPPRRVISRLLDGYDHVIQMTTSGMLVNVFGAAGATRPVVSVARAPVAVAVPAAPPKVSNNVDLDEDNARAAATTGNVPVKPAPSPPPTPLIGRVPPSLAAGSARVSTNVDLDEEQTSR
jgi:hypothetical protein